MKTYSFSDFLKSSLASFCMFLSTAFLYGCATDYQPDSRPGPNDYVPLSQIQIQQRFDRVSLNKGNLLDEIKKCIPTWPTLGPGQRNREYLDKFPSNDISGARDYSSSRKFFYVGKTGICVKLSANKYPIFAVESFFLTANPVGVPPEFTNDWYAKIAREIAIKGRAKVLYVMGGTQNAVLVSYWHDSSENPVIDYSSENKKAGEWESIQVDFTFTHPAMHQFSKTNRGGADKKYFPLGEY